MYEVDEKDVVVPLEGIPQSSVGAPIPFIMADEYRVVLAYYIQDSRPFSGVPRVVGPLNSDETVALIRFTGAIHMSGPPSDEAFAGHPLASRGLRPYSTFRIDNSSWIRKLERMNSVHPMHRPEMFWKRQHLVFTFHDSSFECVCHQFDVTTEKGSIKDQIPRMINLLGWTDSTS
jgi:hypothetical protein